MYNLSSSWLIILIRLRSFECEYKILVSSANKITLRSFDTLLIVDRKTYKERVSTMSTFDSTHARWMQVDGRHRSQADDALAGRDVVIRPSRHGDYGLSSW